MMIKYKVSDVAKDFNVPAKEIIAVLADHNFAGKTIRPVLPSFCRVSEVSATAIWC